MYFNFCNDTQYNRDENIISYDSQVVLCKNNGKCTRFTGSYYKSGTKGSIMISDKINQVTIETSKGDNLTEGGQYQIKIIFIDNNALVDKQYTIKQFPEEGNSTKEMIIEINFNNFIRHLLIQRVLNDYFILTGIIFLLIGAFLCFFGFYEKIAKIVVCIIFGELKTFIILVIVIDIGKKWLELLFIFIGIVIGIALSYYSILNNNFYKIIIGLTSGIIFGNYLVDFILINCHSALIYSIFIDSLLISSISFIIIVKVLKQYYIFLNGVIGGNILIRGISILLYHSLRYRELQIILYFMKRHEWDYFDYKSKYMQDTELFWIYDILIALTMIISIVFYYYQYDDLSKTGEEDSEESNEEKEKGGANEEEMK